MPIHLNLITHGLGNNLFMLAAGLELAFLTGSELVCHEKLEIKGSLDSVEHIANSLHIEIRHGLVSQEKKLKTYRESCPYCFDDTFVKLQGDVILNGYFQNTKYHSNSKTFLLRAIRNYVQEHPKPLLSEVNNIGLQIRLGDYKNKIIRKNIGLLPNRYYTDALQSLEVPHGSRVRIFSDSAFEALNIARNNFPNYFLFEETLNFETPLENLVALSHTRNLILSNSTFGWWAAQLAEEFKILDVVVAPKFWSRTNSCSRQISNSEWVKLPHGWM